MNSFKSFWPIEPTPLKENEVRVSRLQFAQLALLAESDHACDQEMLEICPQLQRYRINRLVVEDAWHPRTFRICF